MPENYPHLAALAELPSAPDAPGHGPRHSRPPPSSARARHRSLERPVRRRSTHAPDNVGNSQPPKAGGRSEPRGVIPELRHARSPQHWGPGGPPVRSVPQRTGEAWKQPQRFGPAPSMILLSLNEAPERPGFTQTKAPSTGVDIDRKKPTDALHRCCPPRPQDRLCCFRSYRRCRLVQCPGRVARRAGAEPLDRRRAALRADVGSLRARHQAASPTGTRGASAHSSS